MKPSTYKRDMGVRKNKNMHFDGSMYIASNIIINQGRAGKRVKGKTYLQHRKCPYSIMPLALAALSSCENSSEHLKFELNILIRNDVSKICERIFDTNNIRTSFPLLEYFI